MRMRLKLSFLVVLTALAAGLGAAWAQSVEPSAAGDRAAADPLAAMDLAAGIDTRLDFDAVRVPLEEIPAGASLPLGAQAPAQGDVDLLAEAGFEDEAFPPEGWTVEDKLAGTSGEAMTQGWSRQICQVPFDGETAAAWALGGGSEGAAMSCGANYSAPVETWLSFGPIDGSLYPGGIQTRFAFWTDTPVLTEFPAFTICVRSGTSSLACKRFSDDTPRRTWRQALPVHFLEAAGRPDLYLYFQYRDRQPPGGFPGVFIDQVVVEGLRSLPTPSPSPTTAPDVPSPTRSATQPGASPTPPPGPTTPSPNRNRAILPVLMQSADKDNQEHFPIAPNSHVAVDFGTDYNRVTGQLTNRGTQFEYGITRLCDRVSWFGFPSGGGQAITLRPQWYQWDAGAGGWSAIEAPTINDPMAVQTRDGHFGHCIAPQGGGPIPLGRFKVEVFKNDQPTTPIASNEAEIRRTAPPGTPSLTPTWTPQATIPASPTPKATPGEGGCQSVIVNSDFERGPAVGWTLITNAQQSDITRVIRRGQEVGVRPAGGEWLALLGGGVDVVDRILSEPVPLPEPAGIYSASLNFSFGIVTEETKNTVHDDSLAPYLVSQDGLRVAIPQSAVSEELIDPNSWYSLNLPRDITGLMTRREGWTEARLLFESLNSPAAPSVFILDEIELLVCTTSPTAPLGGGQRTSSLRGDAAGGPGAGSFAPPGALRRSGPSGPAAGAAGAAGAR